MSKATRQIFPSLVRDHNHACFWSSRDVIRDGLAKIRDFLAQTPADPKFLDTTFSADAPEVASLLFEIHGPEIYAAAFDNNQSFPYGHFCLLSQGGHLAFLQLLVDAGMPLNRFGHSFALDAFRRDDPDHLEFSERVIGSPIKLLGELDSHTSLIYNCKPGMAPRLAKEMSLIEADYLATSYRWYSGEKKLPLKVLAACILSGQDFSQMYHALHPQHHWIAKAGSSHHGRLQLFNLEPDLVSVLGRNANAMFFGLSQTGYAAA